MNLLFVVLLSAAAAARSGGEETGFVPLFNGRDLEFMNPYARNL